MGCDTSYDYNDEADDDNKSLMKMAKILMTMVRKMIAMSKKMMTATKKLMIIAQTNKQNYKKKINDKRDDDTEDDQDDSHIMVCDRDTTDKESLERKNLLNAPHTMDMAVIIIIIIIIPVITIELCFYGTQVRS